MGLDAVVYCNCFETGKLKELPPYPDLISIAPDGSLDYKSENIDIAIEIDRWLFHRACEHENGVLLHHGIGNIALVSLLRNELSREYEKFPVILEKILYSGTHCGDYLSLDAIKTLKPELDYFGKLVFSQV